ncbi:MAG: M13 family metallopeptidase N-terminal domain-containing protein, partial [Rhodanobacteraceae bacterium]
MHRTFLKPLAFALTLALTTGSALAASSFDVSELDKGINPCNDFDGFVNAKWVAANPIPPDRTRWGAFDQLREHSLDTQRTIAEKAAKDADHAKAGSIEQKIGWFYHSGMDDAAVEKAGYAPLKADLDRIAALKSPADIVAWITETSAAGRADLFQVAVLPDFRNAAVQIAYTFQAGLGLPTRDYYEKADYAELREAYKAHVAKVLTLTGVADADAKKQAEQVLGIETRLAKASMAPVELRDPANQYHFVTIEEADKVTPSIEWKKFFSAQGA